MAAESRRDLLDRLVASLPPEEDATIEARARRVLKLVLTARAGAHATVDPNPRLCPNCDTPTDAKRSPYCGEHCREVAGFVRQFRTGLTLGWIFETDKQIALGQNLWDVLGGGRPLRSEIAPPRAREKALARDNRICQSCGAPATTIDHYGSGCNRPSNLRAVCEECCADRSFGDPRVLDNPRARQTEAEIATRIQAEQPLRICDDADGWDWRRYLTERQAAILRT